MSDYTDVLTQALDLRREQRASLAHEILISFDESDGPPAARTKEEWEQLIGEWQRQYYAGECELLDLEEVMHRLETLNGRAELIP